MSLKANLNVSSIHEFSQLSLGLWWLFL